MMNMCVHAFRPGCLIDGIPLLMFLAVVSLFSKSPDQDHMVPVTNLLKRGCIKKCRWGYCHLQYQESRCLSLLYASGDTATCNIIGSLAARHSYIRYKDSTNRCSFLKTHQASSSLNSSTIWMRSENPKLLFLLLSNPQ
jgi:hypothetical protein